MITCKSVSKALEKGDYEKLSPFRKKLLHAHIRLCGMCGNYNGFVMTMQDTAREYGKLEEQLLDETTLPPELAERIKAAAKASQPDS